MMKSKNIRRGIIEIPRGHDGESREESGDVLGPSGNHAKSLDLVVSPMCLRERERAFWRFGAGWWGKRKGTLPYKSDLADPTIMSRRGLSALPLRTVRLRKNLIQ